MAYVVLARKYRPTRFETVVGQDHVTTTLSNALRSGRAGHAYLFIGPRGVGKTTTARILAAAFNCKHGPTGEPCGECTSCRQITDGSSLDVIEMDAASHTGVDNVRELREHARFTPTQSSFKVYIIDEVHMLSPGAFNALLKILEEPPPHVRFILATTAAQKVPATIVSRCQRFEFRRVGEHKIADHLKEICAAESIEYEPEALAAIARSATGSVRDALSLTDQLAASGEGTITLASFHELLGMVDWDSFYHITSAVAAHDTTGCLKLVDELDGQGKDITQFARGLLEYFRHLLVACVVDDPGRLIDAPPSEQRRIVELAQRVSPAEVTGWVERCADLVASIQRHVSPRVALEAFLIRACSAMVDVSLSRIIEKLAELERRVATQPPPAAATGTFPDAGPVRGQETLPGVDPPARHPADSLETRSAQRTAAVDQRLEGVPAEIAGPWHEVLRAVESTQNWTLHSFLSHVRPAGIEGDTYVIEVGPGEEFFRKTLAKREYKRAVEDKIAEVYGQTMRLVCRVNESLAPVNNNTHRVSPARPAAAAQRAPRPTRRVPRRKRAERRVEETVSDADRNRVSSDEGVRKLIELFGGKLVSVRKLELGGET